MWETIGAALTLISTLVGIFVLKKKDDKATVESSKQYARDKSRRNESADDREDILNQREKINQQKEQEKENNETTN